MNTAAIGVGCEAAPGEGASFWKRALGPLAIGIDGESVGRLAPEWRGRHGHLLQQARGGFASQSRSCARPPRPRRSRLPRW
jgi:hypothetical protein